MKKYCVDSEDVLETSLNVPIPKGYKEIIFKEDIPKPQSILHHIHNQLKTLELKTGCVIVLQFAVHNQGLAMILRAYVPSLQKEHTFPDMLLLSEIETNEDQINRIDVLFDAIHKALNELQIVNPKEAAKAGIHH